MLRKTGNKQLVAVRCTTLLKGEVLGGLSLVERYFLSEKELCDSTVLQLIIGMLGIKKNITNNYLP